MNRIFAGTHRRHAMRAAVCTFVCVGHVSPALALEAPSYGLQAGAGLLPPEVIASARFYDPATASLLDADLASAAVAYNACQPGYADTLIANISGMRGSLDYNLQTGGSVTGESERLGAVLAGDDTRMAHDYEALGAILDALPQALPEPCPPEPTIFWAGGYVGVLQSLQISNGGFGGERDITIVGGQAGTVVHTSIGPLVFEVHGGTGDADDRIGVTGVDPVSRTFFQFDGGTQFIPSGLNVTDARLDLDYWEVGGRVSVNLNEWLGEEPAVVPIERSIRFTPVLDLGLTHIGHDERLRIDYSTIDFFIDERREVDTSRLNLGLGLNFRLNLTPSVNFVFSADADANLDFANGQGNYHTAQTGNFDETVRLEKSQTAVTGSLGVASGLRLRVSDNIKLEATGFADWVPVWTLEPRDGAEARLDSEMQTVTGVSANLRMNW